MKTLKFYDIFSRCYFVDSWQVDSLKVQVIQMVPVFSVFGLFEVDPQLILTVSNVGHICLFSTLNRFLSFSFRCWGQL